MRVRAVRMLVVLGVVVAVAWVLRAIRGGPAPALERAPQPSRPWPPLAVPPDQEGEVATAPPTPAEDQAWKAQMGRAVSALIEAPSELRPAETSASGETTWVDPVDGACPATHPIKAKLGSGIYHAPGGLNYDRTRPDRCYASVEAAERDGLRASKR